MATLLVIGGTGFFGKSILDAFKRGLLEPWCIKHVTVMARSPDKLVREAPELLVNGVELYTGDISTINTLPKADYVIHAAASTDASKYLSQGEEEKRNIIMGTLNYCTLAPLFHSDSKIVFCSSGAVYGSQPSTVEYLEEDMGFGDAEGLSESKRAYAYAKRDSEVAIQLLGQEFNMNVSIARCFAFVGKYLPRDQHFAIGNFIDDALAGRPISVKAPHRVYRSYMYADDLVEWLMTISESSIHSCPVYNVGSNEKLELREVAKIISQNFKTSISFTNPTNKADYYVPNIDKAAKELNLITKFSFAQIVGEMNEF